MKSERLAGSLASYIAFIRHVNKVTIIEHVERGWYNEAFLLYLAFNMTEPYSLLNCWEKVNEEDHNSPTPHLGPVTQLTWRS